MIPRLLATIAILAMPVTAFAHGGGLNKEGCHNNRSTGDYHCHRGSGSSSSSGSSLGSSSSSMHENYFNSLLASQLGGRTEVTYQYNYGLVGNAALSGSIRIDIETDEYVIEGGKDKRSSLDSIQQAVFASTLSGKKPAVAIYDTDGMWGKYEHRVWVTAKELGIKFIWFQNGQIRDVQ